MTNLISYRFSRDDLTLKPGHVSGQSALCLVYADTRAYDEAAKEYHGEFATLNFPQEK